MISIISIAASTVINFIVYILKAVFSMFMWFATLFFKALKLLFCALPLTAVSFFLLILTNIVIYIHGSSQILSLVPKIGGLELLTPSQNTTLAIADALKVWWSENIYSYRGTGAFIPLFFLTIIMFIPVVSVFLCISALSSFRLLIFSVVVLDAAIYIIRVLAGKNLLSQYLDRYYLLFPDSGKKHYERSYEKWLKRHHEEFEDDSYGQEHERDKYDDFYDEPLRNEYDDFYEESDDELIDDEYDDDYGNEDFDNGFQDSEYDNDDSYDEFQGSEYDIDDSYNDDEWASDDEYDEDSEDGYSYEDSDDAYDDEYSDDHGTHSRTERFGEPMTSFDFFAGCSSRDSVEKKYRSLAKLYHPDNRDGDTASLQEINAQYVNAKKKFPR